MCITTCYLTLYSASKLLNLFTTQTKTIEAVFNFIAVVSYRKEVRYLFRMQSAGYLVWNAEGIRHLKLMKKVL